MELKREGNNIKTSNDEIDRLIKEIKEFYNIQMELLNQKQI